MDVRARNLCDGTGCGRGDVLRVFQKPVIFAAVFILTHIVSPSAAYGLGTFLFGAGSCHEVFRAGNSGCACDPDSAAWCDGVSRHFTKA